MENLKIDILQISELVDTHFGMKKISKLYGSIFLKSLAR